MPLTKMFVNEKKREREETKGNKQIKNNICDRRVFFQKQCGINKRKTNDTQKECRKKLNIFTHDGQIR